MSAEHRTLLSAHGETRLKPIRIILALTISALVTLHAAGQMAKAPYKDPKLPIEQRVKDLLGRMTLEEKVAQMSSTWQEQGQMPANLYFTDKDGVLDLAKAKVALKDGLGQVSRPSNPRTAKGMAEFTNALQKIAMENTRLGIPIIFHEECLHGLAAKDGTSYPQAIGLAATWDPGLLVKIFDATAHEVRARGAQQCLMPVVDIARDPRWGRTEETYGEDPYLASQMGIAAVQGLQGTGETIDANHVYATLKHFAVHSQSEGGNNVAPANYSERTVREYFLPPFEAAITKAHARTVMPSYNELDGIPNHSNTWLLRDVLRGEFGFKGLVVSDYFAVNELITTHHIAADCASAAKLALTAGVDIELPWAQCYGTLPQLVKSGQVPEKLIDEAVTRLLRAKFELGLFEKPYVDVAAVDAVSDTPEHRALALQAARETITLLKNDGRVLPLDLSKLKKIAVVGPNAGAAHLGGYSGKPTHAISVLQGIKDRVGGKAEVVYAEGCRITESEPDWNANEVVPADPVKDEQRLSESTNVASTADAIVVVVGENEQTSREAWAPNHLGDRDDLDLLGRQDELVKRMIATGKPVVVVLLHGRPNSINYIAKNAAAVLDGWYLGQEGGTALAEVLFGDYNPAGRLPISVPRNVGQLPDYYYYKPSAKRGYLFNPAEPIYPFGYGLSYTTFKYGAPVLASATIPTSGSTSVNVDVTNTGERMGDEVVQMYIHHQLSSVTQPVKILKGFQRVTLKPGETKTVRFTVGPEELRIWNRQMKRVVEPGKIDVMVGPDSAHLTKVELTATQ
jgi:beta-glucosidase